MSKELLKEDIGKLIHATGLPMEDSVAALRELADELAVPGQDEAAAAQEEEEREGSQSEDEVTASS